MQNIQKYTLLRRKSVIKSEYEHRFGVKSIIFEKITKNMFFNPKSLVYPSQKVNNQNWVVFCNLETFQTRFSHFLKFRQIF